jgi:hypothetical protein
VSPSRTWREWRSAGTSATPGFSSTSSKPPSPWSFYADHPDFQQTNTLQSFLGESTGGVTESLKNRVIMPMTGSYQDTDHVLGHELVHAFQYNIAQSRQGPGISGLSRLPLWAVEGMAEYLSVGRDDPLTAMWIRDAARRDDIPTLKQMTRDYRYFPYRFGQAFWAYVCRSARGRCGGGPLQEVPPDGVRACSGTGARDGVRHPVRAMGRGHQGRLPPLMEGRTAPSEVGRLLLAPSTGSGARTWPPR